LRFAQAVGSTQAVDTCHKQPKIRIAIETNQKEKLTRTKWQI
jgi:hypothetical protein